MLHLTKENVKVFMLFPRESRDFPTFDGWSSFCKTEWSESVSMCGYRLWRLFLCQSWEIQRRKILVYFTTVCNPGHYIKMSTLFPRLSKDFPTFDKWSSFCKSGWSETVSMCGCRLWRPFFVNLGKSRGLKSKKAYLCLCA